MRGRRKSVPPRTIHFPLRYELYKPYELYKLSVNHRRARIKKRASFNEGMKLYTVFIVQCAATRAYTGTFS